MLTEKQNKDLMATVQKAVKGGFVLAIVARGGNADVRCSVKGMDTMEIAEGLATIMRRLNIGPLEMGLAFAITGKDKTPTKSKATKKK